MSPIKLFEVLRQETRLSLVGSQRLRIYGPARLIRELNDEIDRHADALIALSQEFGVASEPVASAEAILRAPRSSRACRQERGRQWV